MKTLLLLLFPTLLTAAPTVWIEKGLNIHRIWDRDGLLIYCEAQRLKGTNLTEQDLFVSPSEIITQTVSLRLYTGRSPYYLAEMSTMTWSNGVVSSNHVHSDGEQWATFTSGGNQGAAVFVTDGERHQIINAAVFGAAWKTNAGFCFSCMDDDDTTTTIWWYRSGSVTNGLPWFIGASATLVPGESKLVRVPTPVDIIWKHMGRDSCKGCGPPCWLASWPKPEVPMSLAAGRSGFSFQGAPGCTYSVESSRDGVHWKRGALVEADATGQLDWPLDGNCQFYRVRLARSATMNEVEAQHAWQDLLDFERE